MDWKRVDVPCKACIYLICVPFFIFFLPQVFLIDGSAERAFKTLSASFAPGSLDTYSIVCVTNASASDRGAVFTPTYFAFESALVARVLHTQSAFVGAPSVTAVSYFDGAAVAFSEALQFVNASTSNSAYNSSRAIAYRALVLGLANEYGINSLFFHCLPCTVILLVPVSSRLLKNISIVVFCSVVVFLLLRRRQVATRIQIATTVPPDSDAMAAFVVSMRALLAAASLATRDTALSVDLYLFGAYTSQAHQSEMSQSSATENSEYLHSITHFHLT